MRWLQYLPETSDETERLVHEDDRIKWLLGLPRGQQVLVDPCIWDKVGPQTLPTLEALLPTPPILWQQGPTCGLYAMKMIRPELDVNHLLYQARQLGFTSQGEMFSATQWATIARLNGLDAHAVSIDAVPFMFEERCGVAVVPYDSEVSGIGYRGGKNAHWCVVWKTWRVEQTIVALLTHSSAVLPALEQWYEMERSNRQLEWSTVRLNSEWVYVLSAEGLRGHAVWIDL